MFNNSAIAKSFNLGSTKCAYMITHGIGPYYKTKLNDKIKSASYFVASYDESLNRNFQEEQMDIHIRYFDCNKNMVETKYFDSCFLKRPNSLNLHDCLLKSLDSRYF